MSRVRRTRFAGGLSFPRVSGDEPADAEALKQFVTFSPREWG